MYMGVYVFKYPSYIPLLIDLLGIMMVMTPTAAVLCVSVAVIVA